MAWGTVVTSTILPADPGHPPPPSGVGAPKAIFKLLRQGSALEESVQAAVKQWKDIRAALVAEVEAQKREIDGSEVDSLQLKAASAVLRGQPFTRAVTDQVRDWMLGRDIAQMHVLLRARAAELGVEMAGACAMSLESASAAKLKGGAKAEEVVQTTLADWQDIGKALDAELSGREISRAKLVELQAKAAATVLRGSAVDAAVTAVKLYREAKIEFP